MSQSSSERKPRPKPPYVEDEQAWHWFQHRYPGHPGGATFRAFLAGWHAATAQQHGLIPIDRLR